MRKVLLIGTVILVGVGLILGIALLSGKKTGGGDGKKTSDAFVQNILKGDYDKSYASLGTAAQSVTSQEEWKKQVDQYKAFFEGVSPSYDEKRSTINNDTGQSTYRYMMITDKETYIWQVNTIRQDGREVVGAFISRFWKVN